MENTVVNEAISAAAAIDSEMKQEVLKDFKHEDFVLVDSSYPEIIKDGETPLSKEEIITKHEDYVDRISKMSLTHSLFIGLGFDVPKGHALSIHAVNRYLESTSGQIKYRNVTETESDEAECWEFTVLHPACEYKFLETDFWLAGLRALHFLVTRHDPDLTEYVNRKTAAVAGLDDAWLKQVRA
ncbi:hypothetical protein MOA67_gp105 [Klebsiella phage KpLz-2_45]|uniref:hypothetical protein n=1 Tax=Klebsiella phage KpLz-2_45 TaxID=2698923 RepID=UPI001F12C2B9|nr:hypothetical protein MOA67_gp105 [Klebsiella phage KpLz-2_45]UKS71971.1 hypothetical protein KpLz245_1050 [Klebsiella phage KpLz-2_45]